jgi:hypothetical protein
MAYGNFKPQVWSKHIQHELPKFTVFEQDCDYRFEGEVGKGKTVKILGVAPPTIGNYTGASIGTPEILSDTAVYLAVDQAKYFNFMVDDIDKAQSVEGLMQALMEEATRAMAELRDSYIAELCALSAGTFSSSTAITSATTAKAAVDTALIALWDAGVSQKDDVTMYLSPMVYQHLHEYISEIKSQNDKLLTSGVLGMYAGAKIKMTNNLYSDGTDKYLIVKTAKSVAFASGIDDVEAYRPQDLFSDAVKGLNTYGGKVVRPKEIYALRAH